MTSKDQAPGRGNTAAKQQPSRSDVQQVQPLNQNAHPASIIQRAKLASHSLTPRDVLQMQNLYGNRAVGQMLAASSQGTVAQRSGPAVQAKLTVGPVADVYEREADRVAEQVVSRMNAPVSPQPGTGQSAQRQEEARPERSDRKELQMVPLHRQAEEEDLQTMPLAQRQAEEVDLQTMPLAQRQEEEEDLQTMPLAQRQEEEVDLQTMPLAQRQEEEVDLQMMPFAQRQEEELAMQPAEGVQRQEEEEEVQAKPAAGIQRLPGGGGMDATPELESAIQQARGGGQALADDVREPVEQALGADFSGVRVHTNEGADTLNRSLQSTAFTSGQDIFFRNKEYNPGSSGGQKLLAHELTHVVQQGGAGTKARRAQSPTHPQVSSLRRTLQPAIQRRFGLELEIAVLAAERHGSASAGYWYDEPDYIFAEGEGFKLHRDHGKGLEKLNRIRPDKQLEKSPPIVELVTEAMDETKPIDKVEETMENMVKVAEGMETATDEFTKDARLKDVPGITSCKDHLRVGTDQRVGGALTQQLLAYVQATHGVALKNVPKAFDRWAKRHARTAKPKTNLADAQSKGKKVADEIAGKGVNLWIRKNAKRKAQLEGLCTLLANYLICLSSKSGQQLLKNELLPFAYKTKLSTVVNQLKGSNLLMRSLLFNFRRSIRDKLLAETGVAKNKVLAKKTKKYKAVRAGDWLDQVLKGADDVIWERAKNPKAEELADKKIGRSQEIGMVMENRKYYNVFSATDGRVLHPNKWVDLGRLLYYQLRALEGYPGAEDKVKEFEPKVKGALSLSLEGLALPPVPPDVESESEESDSDTE